MEENEKMDKELCKEINRQVEQQIKDIMQEGVQVDNINMLGKLVDIHKDLANEKYWNVKEEVYKMRYRDYDRDDYGRGNYNREVYGRRSRDSRGRYTGHEQEDLMNDMYNHYRRYSAGREQYNRGNYGAKEDTIKGLEYMLQSIVEFFEMLKEDASSQEEMELIKQYSKEISEM